MKAQVFFVRKVNRDHVIVRFDWALGGKTLYFRVAIGDIHSFAVEKEI
jgi:FKBP-type peptidyl-prolyl cis-trans isomerase 2